MGTWDVGAFDNDEASDWIAELDPRRGADQLRAAVDGVEEGAEAPMGQRAVAAAAIVAQSRGWSSDGTPEEVRSFVRRLPGPTADADAPAQHRRCGCC